MQEQVRMWLSPQLVVFATAVALSLVGGFAITRQPVEVFFLIGLLVLAFLAYFYSFVLSGLVFAGLLIVLAPPGAGVSNMAVLTVYLAAGCWFLWTIRGVWSRGIVVSVGPWLALLVYMALSLAWSPARSFGIQNMLVLAAFVGMMLLTAEYARESTTFPHSVANVVMATTVTASSIFFVSEIIAGLDLVSHGAMRGFALMGLIGVACCLARWRYGSKLAFLAAGAIIAVLVVSLSRTAFVVSLLLIPLARVNLRTVGGWLGFFAWAVIAITIAQVLITRVDAVRSRFFEGDLQLQFAGIPINVMGRMDFWEVTLDSFWGAPWFGHGAGAAQLLMQTAFEGRIGSDHPHNDYLRYLHDYGFLGFALLVLGLIMLLVITFRSWLLADAKGYSDATVHLAAFLSLVAISLALLTDNPIVYVWVMAPLGALVGASIGRASRYPETDSDSELAQSSKVVEKTLSHTSTGSVRAGSDSMKTQNTLRKGDRY